MREKVISALRVGCAVALTSGIAALLSVILQSQELEFRAKLPFVFLILIVIVAKKMGEAAAILSTIAAALVFAFLLFQPLGSLGVVAKTARSSLAWFLLGGMVCAHLLSPAKRPLVRRTQFTREDD
jgi:K+-sensing histidine kinase KdpD